MSAPVTRSDARDAGALVPAIRRNLAGFAAHRAPDDDVRRRAAVTVTVLPHRGLPHVLVIKRSWGRNAGQWAMPGGRVDPGESAMAAALRELHEETAIEASEGDVAGTLDDFVTDSGFAITPFVVVLDRPVRPRRDPHEVHSLHPVPMERLLHEGVPRWQTRGGSRLLQMPLRHDMVVHAPTGAILWQFREVALLGRHTRVHDVAQPVWTRS